MVCSTEEAALPNTCVKSMRRRQLQRIICIITIIILGKHFYPARNLPAELGARFSISTSLSLAFGCCTEWWELCAYHPRGMTLGTGGAANNFEKQISWTAQFLTQLCNTQYNNTLITDTRARNRIHTELLLRKFCCIFLKTDIKQRNINRTFFASNPHRLWTWWLLFLSWADRFSTRNTRCRDRNSRFSRCRNSRLSSVSQVWNCWNIWIF